MIWVGMIMLLFILACMVTMALVLYQLVDRLEALEDDVDKINDNYVNKGKYKQQMKYFWLILKRIYEATRGKF